MSDYVKRIRDTTRGVPYVVGFWFAVEVSVAVVTASPYDPSVKTYGFDSSPFSGAEFKVLKL